MKKTNSSERRQDYHRYFWQRCRWTPSPTFFRNTYPTNSWKAHPVRGSSSFGSATPPRRKDEDPILPGIRPLSSSVHVCRSDGLSPTAPVKTKPLYTVHTRRPHSRGAPTNCDAISGSKITGTRWVPTLRAPRRRSVRSAAMSSDRLRTPPIHAAYARPYTSSPAACPGHQSLRRRAPRTRKTGNSDGTPETHACWPTPPHHKPNHTRLPSELVMRGSASMAARSAR